MPTRTPLLTARMLLAALAACLWACLGGQSGGEVETEDWMVSDLAPCPCVLADRAVVVRGRLLSADACAVRVMVTDVVAGAGHAQVTPGDAIEGRPFTCTDAALEPGEDVVAVFASGQPGESGQPAQPGQISVYPWQESLVVDPLFAEAQALSVSELWVLADGQACRERVYGDSWLGPQPVEEGGQDEQPPELVGAPGEGEPIVVTSVVSASLPADDSSEAFPVDPDDGVSPLDCEARSGSLEEPVLLAPDGPAPGSTEPLTEEAAIGGPEP